MCHTVELAVDDIHVVHLTGVGHADYHHAILRLLAGHILHRHIADGGVEATAAHLTGLVVGIDFQHGLLALANGDVTHVDVLNDAATARVGLDAQHTVQVGRVHLAVLGIDILAATADLRADDHSAVTVLHLAVADDDVLGGGTGEAALATLTTVVVAAALDGDTVVTRIEEAVLDEYPVATLGVAAVTVGAVVVDVYATNGDVLRQEGVDDPERGAQQGDILNQDALTLVEVDELGTQTVLRAEAALVHVDTILGSLQQALSGAVPLVHGHIVLETETGIAHPWPPRLTGTAAVNGTLTRHGDVLLLEGIDTRLQVPAVDTLPAGGHGGV